jgi:hypothetical protein
MLDAGCWLEGFRVQGWDAMRVNGCRGKQRRAKV